MERKEGEEGSGRDRNGKGRKERTAFAPSLFDEVHVLSVCVHF